MCWGNEEVFLLFLFFFVFKVNRFFIENKVVFIKFERFYIFES